MWVLCTLFAAFMQTCRNALKSKLSQSVGIVGTTLARFVLGMPIVACYLVLLYAINPNVQRLPSLDCAIYIGAASVLQIVATGLMVKLFQQNNFTIGSGLAKSEAIIAAVLGVIFFGSKLTLLGWVGIAIGAVAIFFLSVGSAKKWPSMKTLLFGLGSGISFALTSLCVREASLSSGLPFPHSAAWILLSVVTLQTTLLLVFLLLFDRETLVAVWLNKRLTGLISLTSCLGSIGWFSAMALEEVPYVKTLGQIEIFFTLLISHFWLRERFKKYDTMGLILIGIAAVMVMWT